MAGYSSRDDPEKLTYEITGRGSSGDARVTIPGGRRMYVTGVPSSLKKGTKIGIKNYKKGRGDADFAEYRPLEREAETTPTQTPKTGKSLDSDVYLAHIGPMAKGDRSAIAVCSEEVRGMNAYDGLVYLVEHHDDTNVFPESISRKIAKGLYESFEGAIADKAQNEFQFTLEGEAIGKDTTKKLGDYFKLQRDNKYHTTATAAATETSGSQKSSSDTNYQGGEPKPQGGQAKPKEKPSKARVHQARGTAIRKGSPG